MNLQESTDLTLQVPIAILLSYGGFDLCELVKIYHSHKWDFLIRSKKRMRLEITAVNTCHSLKSFARA